MTETDLKNELKKGTLSGVYFFYGDEDYMKNHYAGEMKAALVPDETMAAFNSFSFDDETATIGGIYDAVLSPAMMAERKFIDVSLTGSELFRDKGGTGRLITEAAGSTDTVLLFRMSADSFDPGTAKRPSALLKQFQKDGKCVEFGYQTEGKLVKWLARHASQYGVELGDREGISLVRRAGRSMYRLQGEIRKAAAYAAAHRLPAITEEVIQTVVIKTEEEDAFALANCILSGDRQGALRCLDEKIRRREEPILVLAQITRTFCDLAAASRFLQEGRDKGEYAKEMKMHTYRADLYYRAARGIAPAVLDDAVSRCAEADRLLKSTTLGYIALERLICSTGS